MADPNGSASCFSVYFLRQWNAQPSLRGSVALEGTAGRALPSMAGQVRERELGLYRR